MNTFENTQANFTLISLITFEVLHQTSSYLQAVAVISGDGACKITWKSVENWLRYQRKLGKNNDKNAKRSVNTHCRQWVCGYCDCLGISFFFRLTTSDVRIRRQNRETVKIGCFTSPSIRAISEKQSFLVHFQLGIISQKKKKKKKIYWVYVAIVLVNTLLLLATYPVSLNCSVTHVQRGALTQCCFNEGPHFQRSGEVEK